MKYLLSSLFILSSAFTSSAKSNFFDFVNKNVCGMKVRNTVPKKIKTQFWVPKLVSIKGEPLHSGIQFRDTKNKKSYKLWASKDYASYVVTDLATKKEIVNRWEKKTSCQLKKTTQNMKPFRKLPQSKGFTDKSLYSLMKKNKWGVIYVWSPYMPLSVKGIKDLKMAMAKKRGGHVTVLLDPKADLGQAKRWMANEKVKKQDMTFVASPELLQRDITVHYPIVIMYKDGFLSNNSYVGHKPNFIYSKWIDIELERLSKRKL